MQECHLGDSYDTVKRAVLAWLAPLGGWRVLPMFSERWPRESVNKYQTLLGVSLLDHTVMPSIRERRPYFVRSDSIHIFVDPDTGLKTSECPPRARSDAWAPWLYRDELVDLATGRPEHLTACFDQSLRRGSERADLEAKLEVLRNEGLSAFAYHPRHIAIVVAGQSRRLVDEARRALAEYVPATRLVRGRR